MPKYKQLSYVAAIFVPVYIDINKQKDDKSEGGIGQKMSKSEGTSNFERKCYEAYKLDWMLSHGKTLTELVKGTTEILNDMVENGNTSNMNACVEGVIEDFEGDVGFGGEIYGCFNEFLDCEFTDGDYMTHLFSMMPNKEKNITKYFESTGIYLGV